MILINPRNCSGSHPKALFLLMFLLACCLKEGISARILRWAFITSGRVRENWKKALLGLNLEAQKQTEKVTSSVSVHFSHVSWEDIIDKIPQVAIISE